MRRISAGWFLDKRIRFSLGNRLRQWALERKFSFNPQLDCCYIKVEKASIGFISDHHHYPVEHAIHHNPHAPRRFVCHDDLWSIDGSTWTTDAIHLFRRRWRKQRHGNQWQRSSSLHSSGRTDHQVNGLVSFSLSLCIVVRCRFRYVSSIKSPDHFIDNIVNRQKDVAEKTKVLAFLNKCFMITHKVIQYEINSVLGASAEQKKSNPVASPFTLDELQQAQSKVNDLIMGIERRMASLKTWIPPTMPFLGFF